MIEYAGLMDEPEYAAKMEAKRELADRLGLSLIVIEPDDLAKLDKKLGHLRQVNAEKTERIVCPHCHNKTRANARFCTNCGVRLKRQ